MKLLLSLILLLPFIVLSQESIISGHVHNKNKQPIKNVNLFIEGSYDGATTDSLGYFKFTSTESGIKSIKISAIGYISQNASYTITVNTVLNIILAEENNAIEGVVVQAGQFRVGNLSKSVMSPLDIVTTAGSNGNVIGALDKLPGAQIAGESGRLMVRGGSPNETQTYINGIRVAQPYTNSANGAPVRGRFSPFLFKGTNFSTGGYSAEYGNALSSILNMTTDTEIDVAKTEISLSNIVVGLSNTQKWSNTSLSFNASYTNLAPYSQIIPQRTEWTKPYSQFSGEAILKNKGKNHFFNLYSSYSFEEMGLKDYDINLDKVVAANISSNTLYLNSTYVKYLLENWKWESGVSYGYSNKNTLYNIYYIPNSEYHSHIKSKLNKKVSAGFQYNMGAEFFYDQLQEKISNPELAILSYGYTQNMVAAFASSNLRLWNKIYVEAGIRYSDDLVSNKSLDPRLSIAYQVNNKNQLSFSYGIFHQNAVEEILKYKDDLTWSQAKHYIINYTYAARGRQLRIELFSKKYDKLIQFNTLIPAYNSIYTTSGNGKAQGIDLFWKDDRSIRNLQYWVSYSLTDVNKIEENYPISVQPSYVAKHYFSVVAKYWISQWRSQAGFTNTFSSGRPYNNPNESNFMAGMTKNRNDLSFNWSYLLTQQKIIHLSVTNILGATPTYGYRYSQTPNSQGYYRGQAILPTAKRFVFIGFFWTISKNKKENNLENL